MCVSRSSMAVMYILEIMPIEQMDWVITPRRPAGDADPHERPDNGRDGADHKDETRTTYATAFGMILNDARNAKGMARIAPKKRTEHSDGDGLEQQIRHIGVTGANKRFVSGWNTPWTTPFATSVPVAVRPVKWMLADQPMSSATARTIAVYKSHLRGRFSYISATVSFRSSDCSSMAILFFSFPSCASFQLSFLRRYSLKKSMTTTTTNSDSSTMPRLL